LLWANRSGITGEILPFNSERKLQESALVGYKEFGLYVSEGAQFSFDEEEQALVLAGGEITAQLGALSTTTAEAERHVRDSRFLIRCGPESAGTVEFEVEGNLPVDASFRYFYGPASALRRLVYPVSPSGQAGALRIQVCAALNVRRVLMPAASGASVRYRSCYRTPLGLEIDLGMTKDSGFVFPYDPVTREFYPVLDGPWTMNVHGATVQPPRIDVMLGTSGLEYAKTSPEWVVEWRSGGPAYAPFFAAGLTAVGPTALVSRIPGVDEEVNTAWAAFLPPQTLGGSIGPTALPQAGYYSQPANAPFYAFDPDRPEVLHFREVYAGPFPTGHATLPVTPYGGVVNDSTTPFLEFERQVLATVRRNAILSSTDGPRGLGDPRGPGGGAAGASVFAGATGPLGPSGPVYALVTPRGILAGFDDATGNWRQLTVVEADQGAQLLQFTDVRPPLRQVLLANQLFVVITDTKGFLQACSVRYQLTSQSFATLAANGMVSPGAIANARPMQGYTYENQSYFDAALESNIGNDDFKKFAEDFERAAALAQVVIRDWTFDLSPYLWDKPAYNTFLIFKFADMSLEEMVNDPSLWTSNAFLKDSPADTLKKLQSFIIDAQTQAEHDSDFRYFAETVCRNRSVSDGTEKWNGIICLNCPVPVSQLPPQLAGLGAGIDIQKFRAHHLGVTASSVRFERGRDIGIQDTSLFGLIAYQDTEDLYYKKNDYEYKVLQLKVLFANSQIVNFASQIELLIGKLFGERSSLMGGGHGDNLLLNGVWQRAGDVDSYSFSQAGSNLFEITSQVLETVTIDKAQFATVIPRREDPAAKVQTRFLLWGDLRFQAMPGFDLFSFGSSGIDLPGKLRFSNLIIAMSFNPLKAGEEQPDFQFLAGQMTFDLGLSQARKGSLYSRFPLALSRLVQGDGESTPESNAFMRVFTPLASSSLSGQWFGLVMELNLGSPGGLVAQTGFTASLLAAWAPSPDTYKVYTGLKLPGSSGGERTLTIEGPLKLKMADIQFLTLNAEQPGNESYLLKFVGVSLGFLGISIPPGGKVNTLLFGNPDPGSGASSLGWYAAYLKDKKDEPKNGSLAASLAASTESIVKTGTRHLRRLR